MRFIQSKQESYWFHRFISLFYDNYLSPLFWTERMREKALDLGYWDEMEDLEVLDVGCGTGFTTEGIVQRVSSHNVTCLDLSPHQLAYALSKRQLAGCNFEIGDAENLPYSDESFDRYVSAGSIEYWPNPQEGIHEAFRVLRKGGWALVVGPLPPKNIISRALANVWKLFPTEDDYYNYFQNAGFSNIETQYISPQWQVNQQYALAILGKKTHTAPPRKKSQEIIFPDSDGIYIGRGLIIIGRLIMGALAGFLFIPIALISSVSAPVRGIEGPHEPLNRHQKTALAVVGIATVAVVLGSIWLGRRKKRRSIPI